MKRTTTHQIAIKTRKILTGYIIAPFRVGVLCIILLLPGCMSNLEHCDASNNLSVYGFGNFSYQFQRNNGGNEQPRLNGSNRQKAGNSQNENRSAEKKNLPFQNLAIPVPADDEELHADMHDNNEEENKINIVIPALMRIAIIMLFAVLII
jgi:hypothetical protein